MLAQLLLTSILRVMGSTPSAVQSSPKSNRNNPLSAFELPPSALSQWPSSVESPSAHGVWPGKPPKGCSLYSLLSGGCLSPGLPFLLIALGLLKHHTAKLLHTAVSSSPCRGCSSPVWPLALSSRRVPKPPRLRVIRCSAHVGYAGTGPPQLFTQSSRPNQQSLGKRGYSFCVTSTGRIDTARRTSRPVQGCRVRKSPCS